MRLKLILNDPVDHLQRVGFYYLDIERITGGAPKIGAGIIQLGAWDAKQEADYAGPSLSPARRGQIVDHQRFTPVEYPEDDSGYKNRATAAKVKEPR